MEKLEHPLWIVQAVNAAFGPLVRGMLRALGRTPASGDVIPDYLVMAALIVLFWTVVSLIVRRQLSVDNPGKLQISIEDAIGALQSMLRDYVGHKGPRYLAIVTTMFVFILSGNLMGLVPGLKSPTSSINVTLGCALTVAVYYHIQGVKEQGLFHYLKHFAAPPGAPIFLAPIMLPIEIISHIARPVSLSMRLLGNMFADHKVTFVFFSLVPLIVPVPFLILGVLVAIVQTLVFCLLAMVYINGAVAQDDHGDDHAHEGHH